MEYIYQGKWLFIYFWLNMYLWLNSKIHKILVIYVIYVSTIPQNCLRCIQIRLMIYSLGKWYGKGSVFHQSAFLSAQPSSSPDKVLFLREK